MQGIIYFARNHRKYVIDLYVGNIIVTFFINKTCGVY